VLPRLPEHEGKAVLEQFVQFARAWAFVIT
jgi:hypothetical protein